MKVKIKKQGKVKEFKLISKWEDVTMEKWLQNQAEKVSFCFRISHALANASQLSFTRLPSL